MGSLNDFCLPISSLLSYTAPGNTTDVAKFELTLVLTNDGQHDISIVRDPAGPLFDLPTDAWKWEQQDSAKEAPTFIGPRFDWKLETYLATPGPQVQEEDIPPNDEGSSQSATDTPEDINPPSTTTFNLPAGATREVKYNGKNIPNANTHPANTSYSVGNAYVFKKSGTYKVDLRRKSFWIINRETKQIVEAQISFDSQSVNISGGLTKVPTEEEEAPLEQQNTALPLEKRLPGVTVTTKNCNLLQRLVIQYSARKADQYVEESNK